MSDSCAPFTVPFQGSASAMLSHAKALLAQNHGSLTGNDQKGEFKVSPMLFHVNGTYAIEGQNCTITVTSKSEFVPSCDQIESYVRGHVADEGI